MSFDTLAPHYAWIEALFASGRLQRCRTAMLRHLPAPDQVLVFGEGNGRFTVEFLRRFPHARLTIIEQSTAMIRAASKRLELANLQQAEVRFIEADALNWRPAAPTYDLIVTCFFLDCFREDQLAPMMPGSSTESRSVKEGMGLLIPRCARARGTRGGKRRRP